MSLATVDFSTYHESISLTLDKIGAKEAFAKQSAILIKPNLTADIIIAEGPGDPSLETEEIFDLLGYRRMAIREGIPLVDLNTAPLKKLKNKDCPVFPEMYLPEIAFTHFIISVPVLKAHSLATMTGTLKNMMGFAPPKYYSGNFGVWKKAAFHGNMHQAIIDLNRYRRADLSLMDSTIGLADHHLGGSRCNPPVNIIHWKWIGQQQPFSDSTGKEYRILHEKWTWNIAVGSRDFVDRVISTWSTGLRKKIHRSRRILSTSGSVNSLWCPFWGQKGRYRA